MASLLRNPDRTHVMAIKRQAARALCSRPVGYLINRATRGKVPAHGLRIDTRSPVVKDSTRAQLLWGLYEGGEVRLLRSHMKRTVCVVDLGVSLGVLSCVAAETGKPRRLIGVEANPDLIPLARRNLIRNAPLVTPTLIHGAIDYSRAPGDSVTFAANENHTASAIGDARAGGFTAPAVRLGDLLRTQGVEDYTLLADIEGAEAGLIAHDPESLRNCQQIIIEFHDTEQDGHPVSCAELLEQTRALGFEVAVSYGSVYVLDRLKP